MAPGGSFIWPKHMTVLSMTDLPVLPILASCISSQRSLPSRVRSPTPAKTEKPLCTVAMRAISSVRMTVLPRPAPPKRPILPPRTKGVSRSTTLMPVSNCSVLAESSSKAGGSRWIGQRSDASIGSAAVDRVSEQVEDATESPFADGNAHRAAGVEHGHAADQAVGRSQGDAPHAVTAQVLLDLAGQLDLHALGFAVDLQGVEDVGQVPFIELGVEGRADHLGNASGRRRRRGGHHETLGMRLKEGGFFRS